MESDINKLRKNSKELKAKFRFYCEKLEEDLEKSDLKHDMSKWKEGLKTLKSKEEDKEEYLRLIKILRDNFRILTQYTY